MSGQTSGQTLITHADAARYRAKQGGSQCEWFEPSIAAAVLSRRPTG